MKYAVLSSGSAGNATIVCSQKANILIDCGINKKTLNERLSQCGLGVDDINVLLITHGHTDHISGIKFVPKDKWMTSHKVIEGLADSQYFEPYQTFCIGDISVTPLPLSHDAVNTVGFILKDGDESLVYITDTGFISEKVMELTVNATYYIFESNHDTKMLYTSDRSAYLIRRIHSDIGHLDNVYASTYLSRLLGDRTKEITLAHLSEECNTPEIALQTYNKVMQAQFGSLPNILIRCASISSVLKGGGFLK